MFVLHVKIEMKPGQGPSAERVFADPFKAAISAQEGFAGVQFLRPTDGGLYILSIAFDSQALQQKWAATDLHDHVWSDMEQYFDRYSLDTFTTV
jgi:heme-degrading monooxygenase HmoA